MNLGNQTKFNYIVKEISKKQSLDMIKKYHYSNSLPKLNKHFIGFYLGDILVGTVTLGWGTRPLHTIQKIFPSLSTKDYYEIGRMCMTEFMPKNSESQMISHLIKWIKKNEPNIKVLFTWADGLMGKAGYVYQSCSFMYAGKNLTDIYLKDGIKIHPRQTKQLFKKDDNDKRLTIRPNQEQMEQYNIRHIKGYQFKYLTFLCSKKDKKALIKESLVELDYNYPKENALLWKEKKNNKWVECSKPYYKTDFNNFKGNIKEINQVIEEKNVQLSLFDY